MKSKETLNEYVKGFQKWKETETGQKEMQAHREHENYFKLKLSPKNISKLTKEELTEIYKQFWASRFWNINSQKWNIFLKLPLN